MAVYRSELLRYSDYEHWLSGGKGAARAPYRNPSTLSIFDFVAIVVLFSFFHSANTGTWSLYLFKFYENRANFGKTVSVYQIF